MDQPREQAALASEPFDQQIAAGAGADDLDRGLMVEIAPVAVRVIDRAHAAASDPFAEAITAQAFGHGRVIEDFRDAAGLDPPGLMRGDQGLNPRPQ